MELQISVFDMNGSLLCKLAGQKDWTALRLKNELASEVHIPLDSQQLVHGTLALDDADQLSMLCADEAVSITLTLVRLSDERRGWLAAVKSGRKSLSDAPDEIRADRAIVLAAVEHNWAELGHAVENLRADPTVVLAAVHGSSAGSEGAFELASQALRSDRDFVLALVRDCPGALKYAGSEPRHDREVALEAVRRNAATLQWVLGPLRSDVELVRTAVQQRPRMLRCASPVTSRKDDFLVYKAALEAHPELCADRVIMLAAAQEDPRLLQHAAPQVRSELEKLLGSSRPSYWEALAA